MNIASRLRTARAVLAWALGLTLLVACNGEKTVYPAVYLLNHQHWTPLLVLNFAQETAPYDAVGKPLETAPTLTPPIDGTWRWDDPSRLVFVPARRTLLPDSTLTIDFEGLQTRAGVGLPKSLSYKTPPLTITRLSCALQPNDTPNQRIFQATAHFNYPIVAPSLTATVNGNQSLKLSLSGTSTILASSAGLVRPAVDGTIGFEWPAGALPLAEQNEGGEIVKGAEVALAKGARCEQPLLRAAWDTSEGGGPPVVKRLNLWVEDGKLAVRLDGENLSESARRLGAGQAAQAGISLQPALAGRWTYGEAADGPDLWFKPDRPLPPGARLELSLSREAFAQLPFAAEALTASIDIPGMDGAIEHLALYVDPTDPTIKRITADLRFNHPLKRGSLEAKTAMQVRIEPEKTFENAKALSFELSYDEKTPGLAHLKSEPLSIPERPGQVRIRVEPGVESSLDGEPSAKPRDGLFALPSRRDYFRIEAVETDTAIKPDGEQERLVAVTTTVPVKNPEAIAAAVEVYLLPDCGEAQPDRPAFCERKAVTEWVSADQVDTEVLRAAAKLPVSFRDATADESNPHGWRLRHWLAFAAPEKRQVLIVVKQGIESIDGFRLAQDARRLATLGENQRELKIMHDGALLSLTGTKKLGVAVRGYSAVRVKLQRIFAHDLHHLANFSQGEFRKPDFRVSLDNFAETFSYDETLPEDQEMARQYFAVDFARFRQTQGSPPLGLFLLSVAEVPEEQPPCAKDSGDEAVTVAAAVDAKPDCESTDAADGEDSETVGDQRLVLLTDLGLLVKTARNGEQDVFVMSFRSGQPVAGAEVRLLGKNGMTVAAGRTDAQGRARLPSVEGLKAEKAPAVYVAEKDRDLSFLPYSREDRALDFSRFDTGGVRDTDDSLQAFLFSDRGIYRPGDTVHLGLILKRRDWEALPPDLPLEAVLTDPEGQEIEARTLRFGTDGFETVDWTSSASGKTGGYRLELYIAKNRKKSLGYVAFRVEEFQPDRLQVKTELAGAATPGWLSPHEAKARVTVRNLFGTAAAGNPVRLELTARPWFGRVPAFPDFLFQTTVANRLPDQPLQLGETTTDAQGQAGFELPLATIDEPVFEIVAAGEGFEKGSGRSVVSVAQALVSKHPVLLGYAADGSLSFVPKDGVRALKLLALGPDFKPAELPALTVEVYETRYVSTLAKREDGLFSYQSVRRDERRQTLPLALPGGKASLALPTTEPGQFFAVFKTAAGEELNRVGWTVAGDGNVSRNIERNAELTLSLSKPDYAPGEDVEVQIVAPYQGAGLLTLEQDGVIASRWFKTTGTSSVQRIALPPGTAGNAYLSVAFVRSMDSPEIYMSPLSYGVAPFSISRQGFTNELKLTVPETATPGAAMDLRYAVRDPTRLVLYAVDEGILQFAHYKNPEPLDFFFRKRALQVATHQILDQILPDFGLVQRLSQTGGDSDDDLFGKYKNPFARKHKPPMAFWSGVIDATAGEHHLAVPIPDYFNGTLRVLAVAANARKAASTTTRVIARNPYVIQPQQPYAVAPGDTFDLGVLIANTTGETEPKNLTVSVEAPAAAVEFAAAEKGAATATATLNLAPNQDGTVRFRARAGDRLGPVNLVYKVSDGQRQVQYSEELSIRPSQPLLTTLQAGVLSVVDQQNGKTVALNRQRTVFPEQGQADFSVAVTPLGYLRGIVEYLRNYPYGCTEQLVSQSFPAVVLGANAELGLDSAAVGRFVAKTVKTLVARQKFDGRFGLWTSADEGIPLYSMYATHFLVEARERGFAMPDALYQRALEQADQYAQQNYYDWPSLEAQAYALYLLARNQQSIAERLRSFEASVKAQTHDDNPSLNRIRFLLGAAYKLQQLDGDADRFFGEFQRQWEKTGALPWNVQADNATMSLYLYLANRHFREQLDTASPRFGAYLLELAQDLAGQRVNSYSGSWAALGLGSLWNRFDQDATGSFTATTGTPPAALTLQGKSIKQAALAGEQRTVELKGNGRWNLFYQLAERGYDREAPSAPIVRQLSIQRSLLNEQGREITELGLQDKLQLRIGLHPDRAMNDIAVVMLIPGGFEIDLDAEGLGARKSLPIKGKPLWEPEYIDVQEDRVVFFGDLPEGERFFEFRLKPLNTGIYRVPPVFAEGMYDGDVLFRGTAGSLTVRE